LGALALFVETSVLDSLITVGTICHGGNVVTMDTKVDIVFSKNLNCCVVGCVRNNLIDPLAGSDCSITKIDV
jgi:hypothetical protein